MDTGNFVFSNATLRHRRRQLWRRELCSVFESFADWVRRPRHRPSASRRYIRLERERALRQRVFGI